jgi:adenylate cyclase
MSDLLLRLYERQRLVYWGEFDAPVELGRQTTGEPGPFAERQIEAGLWRLVIAHADEPNVSRQHLLVSPLSPKRVRLENLRGQLPILLHDGTELAPRSACEMPVPYRLDIGKRSVEICPVEADASSVHTLAYSSLPPGHIPASRPLALSASVPDFESLFRWLQAAIAVLQSATGSSDFFRHAAHSVIELVGLDSCGVLLRDGSTWKPAALEMARTRDAGDPWQPSRQVMDQVCREKTAIWQVPRAAASAAASLAGVKAVIAAPILDRQGDVIGVLYGDRRFGTNASLAPEINKIEAMLVELLAYGVAAGLARAQHEQAAIAARVRFEQFFTPELSRQLASQPDLLTGRDAEITVVFSDIRGFSRLSERLGPAKTVEWVSDVLGTLSACALEQSGVLVDYLGDEVITMWGAPEQQPDHARLACSAALRMLARLPELNERWQSVLQEPIKLGIGINTGIARVGNIGSSYKFKYGPLGGAVNLASRVQGATKYFFASVLATQSTVSRIGPAFATRRLGRVRVVNITEPVELYEVSRLGTPGWPERKGAYEKALVAFERGDFTAAIRELEALVARYPTDGPASVLMSRALSNAGVDPAEFDRVWQLPGK